MKRIIVLLAFVLFGTILYSQTVNYIYNSKGDKIYFNRTGKNVIWVENISDTNVVKEIKMLDSNVIVRYLGNPYILYQYYTRKFMVYYQFHHTRV